MGKLYFYNYREYITFMKRNGFDDFEINYYKDKINELEELLNESKQKLTEEEKEQKALNEYIANI